jgi:Ca2+-binding EF-hand superfamily protein
MLSDFQKEKFGYLFKLIDANQDDRIDTADFDVLVERLGEAHTAAGNTARLAEVSAKYREMFDGMMHMADTNRDGKVTLEEFLAFEDVMIHNKEMYDGLAGALTDIYGELLDRDGDGKNDVEDYRAFLEVLHVESSQADEIFKKMDKNHDGQLTRNELQETLLEFYLSDDRAAPGNFFFGKF